MQRLLVLDKESVLAIAQSRWVIRPLSEAPKLIDRKLPCAVGVVPIQTAVVTASEKTLEGALAARFPPAHSFRTEPMGPNQFQAFAIPDDLFAQLRALGKQVMIIPYAIAVRQAMPATADSATRIFRIGQAILGAEKGSKAAKSAGSEVEQVVIDGLKPVYLFTLLRGREVIGIRSIRGGDPLIELQRTIAASRMNNPQVLCSDEALTSELLDHDFQAQTIDGPLVGWTALEQVTPLRFLHTTEVAAARAKAYQLRALSALAASVVLVALAAGAWWMTDKSLHAVQRATAQLETRKQSVLAELNDLFPGRFAAKARSESVTLHNELLALSLVLPPQVQLVSLEKTLAQVNAVIERRADAAPFSRIDLEAALASTPYFGKPSIQEEYAGPVIRYNLTFSNVPTTLAASP